MPGQARRVGGRDLCGSGKIRKSVCEDFLIFLARLGRPSMPGPGFAGFWPGAGRKSFPPPWPARGKAREQISLRHGFVFDSA